MKRISGLIIFITAPLFAVSCSSFSLDKERATEQRKQTLCDEIDTRDLPHCSGVGTGVSALTPEIRQANDPFIPAE